MDELKLTVTYFNLIWSIAAASLFSLGSERSVLAKSETLLSSGQSLVSVTHACYLIGRMQPIRGSIGRGHAKQGSVI